MPIPAEAQVLIDEIKAEQKKLKEVSEKHGGRLGEVEERIQKSLDGALAQLKAMETAMSRPQPAAEDLKIRAAGKTKAFLKMVSGGYSSLSDEEKRVLTPEEVKVLQVSQDTAGGYFCPPEFVREIIKGVVEFSPVRELATVTTTSKNSVQFPRRTGVMSASWASEAPASDRSENTNPTYGMETINTHEMVSEQYVSNELLQDSEFDLESELRTDAIECFANAEGAAFITGTGNGKPLGILDTNSGLSATTTASNDTLAAVDFVSCYYALKEKYRKRATWLLNDGIIAAVRKMTNAVTGEFLWVPGFGDEPSTLMGRPYRSSTDMAASVADAAKVAILADFKTGYRIVDRVQISLLRDPYTQGSRSTTKFIFTKRVGGKVVLPEAMRYILIQ